jgi:hypothetical protein
MSGIFGALGKLLTHDLTGNTSQREVAHPFFRNLIYFGSKNATECYWEAELPLAGQTVGVNMTGTSNGPTSEEEEFCRRILSDPEALFAMCRSAFEPKFERWAKRPLPAAWSSEFKLDGFQVPLRGDLSEPWEVCYFVQAAGHYFTAVFETGKVEYVNVDG